MSCTSGLSPWPQIKWVKSTTGTEHWFEVTGTFVLYENFLNVSWNFHHGLMAMCNFQKMTGKINSKAKKNICVTTQHLIPSGTAWLLIEIREDKCIPVGHFAAQKVVIINSSPQIFGYYTLIKSGDIFMFKESEANMNLLVILSSPWFAEICVSIRSFQLWTPGVSTWFTVRESANHGSGLLQNADSMVGDSTSALVRNGHICTTCANCT